MRAQKLYLGTSIGQKAPGGLNHHFVRIGGPLITKLN